MDHAITVGQGKTAPQGRLLVVDSLDPVRALQAALDGQPSRLERWWSPHTWANAYRRGAGWESACGVAVDLDYYDDADKHVETPADVARQLHELAVAHQLPGQLFHLTPRGARLVFVFAAQEKDRDRQLAASRAAGVLAAAALAAADLFSYRVDQGALEDLARLLYTPTAIIGGRARDAAVLLLSPTPAIAAELAAAAPPPPEPEPAPAPAPRPRPQRPPRAGELTLEQAVQQYNAQHQQEWPRKRGPCPICGSPDGFARADDVAHRWHCFSTSHKQGGVAGAGVYRGDQLDIDAHQAGVDRVELLRREGLLPVPTGPREEPPPPDSPPPWLEADEPLPAPRRLPTPAPSGPAPTNGHLATVLPIHQVVTRPLKSHSFLAIVEILSDPVKRGRFLGDDSRIEWNEMGDALEINRAPVAEHDIAMIRAGVERCFVADKKGGGMKFGEKDIKSALAYVASQHRYHPVQEYLRGLTWDQVPRLEHVPEDLLDIDSPTQLTRTLLRKWFIGAVARAMKPGCQLKSMLILCGNQNAAKSKWFETLASPAWFNDTDLDIRNKETHTILSSVWIQELQEMSSLEGQSAERIKGFVSVKEGKYVPKFSNYMTVKRRTSVLVASANRPEGLLTDDTGNVRFWPILVGRAIAIEKTTQLRDQLWAEALVAFNAGEHWWLNDAESKQLSRSQRRFEAEDPWEDIIVEWLERWEREQEQLLEAMRPALTTALILYEGVQKPRGQLTRLDQNRVGAIMRGLQYRRTRQATGKRGRCWVKHDPSSSPDDPSSPRSSDPDFDPNEEGSSP